MQMSLEKQAQPSYLFKRSSRRTLLAAQWLRLPASTGRGMGSIPSQGGKKKKEKIKIIKTREASEK